MVNPRRLGELREWRYGEGEASGAVVLKKGDEMGRFLLGSTVVLLFPASFHQFHPKWVAGGAVRLGEAMGQAIERAMASP